MTNEDFNGLFSADDAAELAAAAAAVDAEVAAEAGMAPKKDGLWFSHNYDDANGHAISVYVVVMGGKTVLRARVNTALVVTADDEAAVAGLPAGVTAHRIEILNATGTQVIATRGFAVMAPHNDGTGTHIDGQTVRSFVVPRISRLLGELYGV